MEYWWKGSTSTAIPQTSASDIVDQYNKTGDITFAAALVDIKEKGCPCFITPGAAVQSHTHTDTYTCACTVLTELMSVFLGYTLLHALKICSYYSFSVFSLISFIQIQLYLPTKFFLWGYEFLALSYYLHRIFQCCNLLYSLISGYLRAKLTKDWHCSCSHGRMAGPYI